MFANADILRGMMKMVCPMHMMLNLVFIEMETIYFNMQLCQVY